MDRIGLTGSTGSLGKLIYKNKKNLKIFRFKGDIRNKKEVFEWIHKNDLKIIIHLAAIVPIKTVNENKRKAKEVNYFGSARHSSVATVHPSLYHQVVFHNEFEKCPTCSIGAALKFFAFYGWQEHLDDALNFICGIADCPREAFVLYCLFLKRFELRRSDPEVYTFAYLISGINSGLNYQNFFIHRECRSAVDQKVQDVFKYLAFKLNPHIALAT